MQRVKFRLPGAMELFPWMLVSPPIVSCMHDTHVVACMHFNPWVDFRGSDAASLYFRPARKVYIDFSVSGRSFFVSTAFHAKSFPFHR